MKHILLFENYTDSLNVGDNTNYGVIEDKTAMQYCINGQWYHHSIIKAEIAKPITQKQNTKKNKLLIVVDVQPDYANHIHFSLKEFRNYVSKFYRCFIFI